MEVMEINQEVQDNSEKFKVNFLDASQGLECWQKCKSHDKMSYSAYAKIRIFVKRDDFIAVDKFREFIRELFEIENIFEESTFVESAFPMPFDITFTVFKQDIDIDKDAEEWLTKCTILNTYREYFTATTGIAKVRILFGIDSYDSKSGFPNNILSNENLRFTENLAINHIAYTATSAKKELGESPITISQASSGILPQNRWYAYNLFYSQLSESLEKFTKQ